MRNKQNNMLSEWVLNIPSINKRCWQTIAKSPRMLIIWLKILLFIKCRNLNNDSATIGIWLQYLIVIVIRSVHRCTHHAHKKVLRNFSESSISLEMIVTVINNLLIVSCKMTSVLFCSFFRWKHMHKLVHMRFFLIAFENICNVSIIYGTLRLLSHLVQFFCSNFPRFFVVDLILSRR